MADARATTPSVNGPDIRGGEVRNEEGRVLERPPPVRKRGAFGGFSSPLHLVALGLALLILAAMAFLMFSPSVNFS